MKIFGYGRVSTGQQTTENQRLELEQAGYLIESAGYLLLELPLAQKKSILFTHTANSQAQPAVYYKKMPVH